MAFKIADRVLEVTLTTGLGAFELSGAASGYQDFVGGIGDGVATSYVVVLGDQWAVYYGTVTDGSPPTISRDALIDSSTGSDISWGSGTKTVYATPASSSIVCADETGAVDLTGKTLSGGGPHDLQIAKGYVFGGRTYFTSSGTYNKSAGLRALVVRALGAGGAGGAALTTSGAVGAGGGSGGYSEKLILAASVGSTETVTVGAGGTGGSSPTGGGTSSFGSHISATGGSAGETRTTAENAGGGSGGTGTGGSLNISGGRGENGFTSIPHGGTGASSSLGLGAGGIGGAPNGNGSPASGYGAGGGGAARTSTNRDGGAGAGGIVIVDEYF